LERRINTEESRSNTKRKTKRGRKVREEGERREETEKISMRREKMEKKR
jgi:hypothetical protein